MTKKKTRLIRYTNDSLEMARTLIKIAKLLEKLALKLEERNIPF